MSKGGGVIVFVNEQATTPAATPSQTEAAQVLGPALEWFEHRPPRAALVHESELARNEPDSQVHHLPRAYDDGLPSSAIRLRM